MAIYITVLLSVFLLVMAALALYCDIAYVKLYRKRVGEKVYHCLGCNALYTSRTEDEQEVCPVCQRKNIPLKF